MQNYTETRSYISQFFYVFRMSLQSLFFSKIRNHYWKSLSTPPPHPLDVTYGKKYMENMKEYVVRK